MVTTSVGYKIGRFFGEVPWWLNMLLILMLVVLFVRGCPAVFEQTSMQRTKSLAEPPSSLNNLHTITSPPVPASGQKTSQIQSDLPLKSDLKLLVSIESMVLEIEQSLKKYYGSKSQLKELSQAVPTVAMIVLNHNKNGATIEQKKLSSRAAALGKTIEIVTRKVFVSTLEEKFVANGMDVKISATGAANKLLQFKYPLMSKPLVYKLTNEMDLQDLARQRGFEKIIFTNGFKSSIGETWTVNLAK
jgi:hypothetical protein